MRGAEPKFRRALGWSTLGMTLFSAIGYVTYAVDEPGKYLPLQICDIAGMVAPLALLTGWRPLRAVLYFWGIGLTTQGFITPIVTQGPDDWMFWWFWMNHFVIVFAALYELIVAGFRPDRRDLLRTVGITAVYATIIFFFDRATGWNYLFLGESKPQATTLIDALGPYPLRVVWIVLLALLMHLLVYAPWAILRRLRGRRQES